MFFLYVVKLQRRTRLSHKIIRVFVQLLIEDLTLDFQGIC